MTSGQEGQGAGGCTDPGDCAEVGRVLQAHLDGEVDAGTAARVSSHLGDCPPCGMEAESFEQVKRALRSGVGDLPPECRDRLRDLARRLVEGADPRI